MKKVLSLIKNHRELIVYLIVGVLTTLVNLIVYLLFTRVLLFNEYVSNLFAWVAAVLFAFVTNKFIVFKSMKKDFKTIFKEASSFIGMRIISLGLDMLCMFIVIDILLLSDLIAKLFSQIIVTLSNYIFSKLFIFKKK